MHPVIDTTEVKCTYQPKTDTVLIVQDGTKGIKVLEIPAADLQRALDEKPYNKITPGDRFVPRAMPNIVKPSLLDRIRAKSGR